MEESWLSRESVLTQPVSQPLSKRAVTEERRLIETALAKTRGRVSGPSGAAASWAFLPPRITEPCLYAVIADRDKIGHSLTFHR